MPEKPSDLPHFTCPSPRTILKPTSAPILVREVQEEDEEEEEEELPEPFEDPCAETVVEKAAAEQAEEEPPRRVSKFKAMRAQK